MVMSGFTSMPGVAMSIRMKEMPSCRLPSLEDVRTRQKIQFAQWAAVVQIFCPLMTKRSSCTSQRVLSEARSEPAPGSE